MEIGFFGRSDDLAYVHYKPELGIDAYEHMEEYSFYDNPILFLVEDGFMKMYVIAQYENNGCWGFTPLQYAEDYVMPPCRTIKAHSYSSMLLLTCSGNAKVKCLTTDAE